MKKISLIILGLIVIAIGGYLINQDARTVISDTKPTAVVSFYPLHYFASEIVGDTMNVVNVGRNNDPHDFIPSSKDVAVMQRASIVVLQGAGLEAWGEDMEHQLEEAGVPVFVANEHLALHENEESEEEHSDEHEDGHDEDEHHHDHGDYDPHTWLDPILAAQTVAQLAEELSNLAPENAALYEQNAQVLTQKLSELDRAYEKALSPAVCSADEVLISHDAFGYIARRYELTMHPIAGISTKDEPSAKLLAELREEAQEGVLAVLTEENSVKKFAQTIVEETGIALIPINALATGTMANNGDYLTGMYDNLESFTQGYGCTTE